LSNRAPSRNCLRLQNQTSDVVVALTKLKGEHAKVRINSGGGLADEGVAIYNALRNHKGGTTIYVDGVAASAASIIAMASDKRVMRKGSLMMIHDPMTFAVGNAAEMHKAISALDAMGDAMADVYSSATKRPAEAIRTEMREEIWLDGTQAVEKGYATEVEEDEAIEAWAFDYRAYQHAPEQIVALSDARSWSNRLKSLTAKATETPKMTVPSNTPAPVDHTAAIKAETDRAAGITSICAAAGVVMMAATFIRDGLSIEQAQEKITAEQGRMKAIRDKVAQARTICPMLEATLADQFIAAGSSAEAVSEELLTRIAAVSAANPTRSSQGGLPPTDEAQSIATWDKLVNRSNARRGFAS
jgi:ATP-dependent Clp protease protease subunit